MKQETEMALEHIPHNGAHGTCQRLGPTLLRFTASLKTEDSVKFGDELSMDFMFLDGKAAFNIVNTETRF